MSSLALVTIVSSFLASSVEFVEAVTIVLAVGVTRQWRSALMGVACALAALALLVAVFGTAIVLFVPINVVRLIVGGFLVIYGLQWLTKAVLRAGGAMAKHDEAAIYAREIAALQAEPPVPATGMDWISFTVATKGVLLEGLEVAFIVVTFGATAGMLGPAVIGAAIGGYRRHRVSDPARAPLWGLASGALVAAMTGATLLTALLIHPTVRSTPGLVGAWSAVFVGGLLVGSVGALLWERDVRRHRLEALLFLAFVLIPGGAFLSFSTDPWPLIGAFVCLGGFGVLLVALETYRRSSRRDPAVPDTWR